MYPINKSDLDVLRFAHFLALAVIGGISRWPGALLGAALFQLVFPIVNQPFFLQNVVFKNVFHGQLSALLYVTFGLGGIGLNVIQGAIFVFCVLLFRRGIVGEIADLLRVKL